MVSEPKSNLKSLGSKRSMPVQSRPPAPDNTKLGLLHGLLIFDRLSSKSHSVAPTPLRMATLRRLHVWGYGRDRFD